MDLERVDWGPQVAVDVAGDDGGGGGGGVVALLVVVFAWWLAEQSPWDCHCPHTYMPFSGQISPGKTATHITPKKRSVREWVFCEHSQWFILDKQARER